MGGGWELMLLIATDTGVVAPTKGTRPGEHLVNDDAVE
jgi:hypothetical protein